MFCEIGGAGARDDLKMGHQTQTWLAVRPLLVSQAATQPAPTVNDANFQDRLIDKLAEMIGETLFG